MKDKKRKNMYEILKVSETATAREIKRGYRKKILQLEKEIITKGLTKKLVEKIILVNNSYYTLSDIESRILHDKLYCGETSGKRYSSYNKDDYFRVEQEDFVEELNIFFNDYIIANASPRFKEKDEYLTLLTQLEFIIDSERKAIKKKARIKL